MYRLSEDGGVPPKRADVHTALSCYIC